MYQSSKTKNGYLRVRLNESMYTYVCEMASKNNMTASAYIRDLISKDIQEMSKEK